MKVLQVFAIIIASILLIASSSNPPDGNTGAPGDGLCSNCHVQGSSGNLAGSVVISGLPGSISPNTSYSMTVTVNNTTMPPTDAERGGFQLVALDGNNNNVGTWSAAGSNSTFTNSGGKTYWEHNGGAKFFSGGSSVSYTATWKSPASAGGNTVTMYAASIIADLTNGNDNDLLVTTTSTGVMPAPANPKVTISNLVNPLCNMSSDGSMMAVGSMGTPPYTFSWSNGAQTALNSNIPAGTYTVTITDNNMLTDMASATITAPTLLIANASTVSNNNCAGENKGSVKVTVSGGVTPYTYSWSNGGNTSQINNLIKGEYVVTVTDKNMCTTTGTASVTDPDPLQIVLESINNPNCKDDLDGAITIQVNGGTFPYKYKWSSNETTQNLVNKKAGSYTITVTDNKNCTKSSSYTITTKDFISPTLQAKDNVIYYLNNQGQALIKSADLIISLTDNCPGNIKLSMSGRDSLTCTNIGKTNYYLTAEDASGNKTADTTIIEVRDSTRPIINCTSNSIVYDCNYKVTAPVVIENCSLSELKTIAGPKIGDGIIPGINKIVYQASDINGNISSCTSEIEMRSSLKLNIDSVYFAPCAEDGYDVWINCKSAINQSYILIINKDSMIFNKDTIIKIHRNDSLLVFNSLDSYICQVNNLHSIEYKNTGIQLLNHQITHAKGINSKDGEIEVNISGGKTPYSYQWKDSSGIVISTNEKLTGTNPGTYTLVITDYNGCSKTYGSFIIQSLTITSKEQIDQINIYPNPAFDNLFIKTGNLKNVEWQLLQSNGMVYSQGFIQGEGETISTSLLEPGIYFVAIKKEGFQSIRKIIICH